MEVPLDDPMGLPGLPGLPDLWILGIGYTYVGCH